MAQATTDQDLDRPASTGAGPGGRSRGAGIPLADEGPDEFPALLAFAVCIAVLTVGLIWPTLTDGVSPTGIITDSEGETAAEPDASADSQPESETGVDPAEGSDDDVTADPSADDRAPTDDADSAGEDEPETVVPAAVEVTAAQVSIVLDGIVPDDATREAIVAQAMVVYSEAQVDDRLTVDQASQLPALVTIAGSMTDAVLYNQVVETFASLDGVELADTSGFALEESGDLEAALNGLDPIQFDSGTAMVRSESATILEEAASLLVANPDVVLEIGGHTDSLGGEEANQTLGEARANAVLTALTERGVENEMTAVGFGERRLQVSPDEHDLEAQQTNRRIEFRIIG